jgi:hypothetical protein
VGLQSKLFRGDPKLEAAAVPDPARIMLGTSAQHVQKIQAALILLDGAAISANDVQLTFYGTSTAGVVLTYKQKRNIINRNYQTQADNIVGKMTIASIGRCWAQMPRLAITSSPIFVSSFPTEVGESRQSTVVD